MAERDLREFRTELKEAKKFLRQGRYGRAEFHLLRAMELADYLPEKVGSGKRAFVHHRLAEVALHRGEPMVATRRFRTALSVANKDDILGYARIKRDYGEFLRRHGDSKAARREIESAYRLIDGIEKHTARITFELLVTEGFIARCNLTNAVTRVEAVEMLRMLAHTLRGYKKPEYELAVLRCLIEEVLPIYSLERASYIRRAIALSIKLGNRKKAGEYVSLAGGSLPQHLYRFVAR